MDSIYGYDEAKVEAARARMPWVQSPRCLKKVKISPSAIMKMLTHAQSGVEKGVKQRGKPVEVMGLILGKPDVEDQSAIIVTDVFPLPVEGAETRVLADDDEVTAYMINLSESIELTRRERLIGWYHSHPFEVDVNSNHSHCFLSSTDVSTQLFWQRAEDRNGNPWLAIVIDPLHGIYKGVPELLAFRVFPPEYSNPNPIETPDGDINESLTDLTRVSRWGALWNRYHVLKLQTVMSKLTLHAIVAVDDKFLWMKRFKGQQGHGTKNNKNKKSSVSSGFTSSSSSVLLLSDDDDSRQVETMLNCISSMGCMNVSNDVLNDGRIGSLNLGIDTSHDALTEITKLAVFSNVVK